MLEPNEFSGLDNGFFNLITWIFSLNTAKDKNGFIGLSYCKATKIRKIVQNIQLLVPGAQPGLIRDIVINNLAGENSVTDSSE